MRDVPFREWVMETRGYSLRASGDAVSRCKRVERLLRVNLDTALRSAAGYERLQERVASETEFHLKPGASRRTSVGVLRSAIKLYRAFLVGQNQ